MSTTKGHLRTIAGTLAFGAALAVISNGAVWAQQRAPRDSSYSARHTRGVVINDVQFEGNKKIEKAILEQYTRSKSRSVYNKAIVDADAEVIREIYRRSGRSLAKVTPRIIDLPNGKVDVVFTVVEGGKTGIKEIKFVGNNIVSSGRLKNQMATTEMNFLSFLKNTDIYDPDRLASDENRIRRYYMKHGYADMRINSTDVRFDEEKGGYVVTISLEEGQQYRVGNVSVESRINGISSEELNGNLEISSGGIYNGNDVEKSLLNMTNDVTRKGVNFVQVRPVADRDPASKTVNLKYIVEDGPRVYVERIEVRGNTRTRDYVVRREFDLAEGDAYNRVLVQRAERRLNNLGYFKNVKVFNEPGSSPDRVVVVVEVEDQSTGSFSISGGYSTSDGIIGEVSVSESNFLGRGQFVKVAGSWGENTQGVDFSFTEPYFMGYRLAVGIDLYSKYNDMVRYSNYESRTTGGQLRFGLPLTEEMSLTFRYALYQQDVKVPNTAKEPYMDCSVPIPGVTLMNGDGTPNRSSCEGNREASLAIKQARGEHWTSLVGATWLYSTLDNKNDPRAGFHVEVKPEVAGLGGDSKFLRVSGDARYYHELNDDFVGMVRLQGGHISGLGSDNLNIMDHYFMGPSLVRGFAPSGLGPRDISSYDSRGNAIGGTTYFGGTLEVQFPIFGLPRELGLKGALFADAGTVFGYEGDTRFDLNNDGIINGYTVAGCSQNMLQAQECMVVHDKRKIRSSIGASLMWNSPLGPIRLDYAHVVSKDKGLLLPDGRRIGADREQSFRFSGGRAF